MNIKSFLEKQSGQFTRDVNNIQLFPVEDVRRFIERRLDDIKKEFNGEMPTLESAITHEEYYLAGAADELNSVLEKL